MLSEDGDAYYRAELKKRLKGHDKSEWDKNNWRLQSHS